MKNYLLLIFCILMFFAVKTEAQLRPADSQYLSEKGALVNPSFEQSFKGWTFSGTCSKQLVADAPLLNRTLRITCVSQNFSLKQETTSLTFLKPGTQGAASLKLKLGAQLDVSLLNNGSRESTFTYQPNTEYELKKNLPFVIDSVSNGIEVHSDSNVTGIFYIDDVEFGVKSMVQNISQAHFVGSLVYDNANCLWQTTSGTMGSFPVDSDCVPQNITGNVLAPDTRLPAIKLPNVLTGGYYSIETQGLLYKLNTDGVCTFSTSTSGSYENQGVIYVAGLNSQSQNGVIGNFRFNTPGDKQIEIIAERGSGTGSCEVYGGGGGLPAKFTVRFHPDSNSTVVSQDVELTAETANEFSAHVDNGATITNENYDWISGNCSIISSQYHCTPTTGLFTQVPNCWANFDGQNTYGAEYRYSLSTTTNLVFVVTDKNVGTVGVTSQDFNIFCSKAGVDVNKSATIVGKFENINSSDLVDVTAEGNTGGAVTAGVTNIDFTEVFDNKGAWDGDEYTNTSNTARKVYFKGLVAITTNSQTVVEMYIDTGSGYSLKRRCGESVTDSRHVINCALKLNPGEKVAFRLANSLTLSNSTANHWLEITEHPDTESIVKNLLAESSQTKCQTKVMTSNHTTSAIISELTFNNLTIGKRYRYNVKLLAQENPSPTSGFKEVAIEVKNGSAFIDRLADRTSNTSPDYHRITLTTNLEFTATDSTLTTEATAITRMLINGVVSSGTRYSRAQLCQLPGTYVKTTEF